MARQHLWQALSEPDVTDGAALYIGTPGLVPAPAVTPRCRPSGSDPAHSGFLAPGVAAGARMHSRWRTARSSTSVTRDLDAGRPRECRRRRAAVLTRRGRSLHVTGTFRGGVGFSADGYMIVSDQTFLCAVPAPSCGRAKPPAAAPRPPVPNPDVRRMPCAGHDRLVRRSCRIRTRCLDRHRRLISATRAPSGPTGIIFGFGVVNRDPGGDWSSSTRCCRQMWPTTCANTATFKAVGYPHRFFVRHHPRRGADPGCARFPARHHSGHSALRRAQRGDGATHGDDVGRGAGGVPRAPWQPARCRASSATRRLAAADPAELFWYGRAPRRPSAGWTTVFGRGEARKQAIF